MIALKRIVSRSLSVLSVVAAVACAGASFAADQPVPADTSKALKEMPVLSGADWQSMKPDNKLAFILGVGHVVTIEENVIQKHPDLKRKGFVAKLAEGLAGVPMDTIIQTVDTYYQKNPDNLDLPVLGVIWQELVKPKLKAGIADQPLASRNGQ